LVDRALGAAKASSIRPRGQLPVVLPGLGLVDARVVHRTSITDTLETIEADVRDAGATLKEAHVTTLDDVTVWASSTLGAVREPARQWRLTVVVETPGRGTKASLRTETRTRSWATLASLPYGQQAAKAVLRLHSAAEHVQAPCPVVLLPAASASLLRWLAEQVAGATASEPPAWLLREQEVVDARLHLRDDGLAFGGLRTQSFDVFGDPPRARQLFAESRWCDAYAIPGATGGGSATGHAHFDGAVRHRGLSMPAGLRSVHALHAEIGGPLIRLESLPPLGRDSGPRAVPLSGTVWHGTRQTGAFRDQPFIVDPVAMVRKLVAVSSETDRHDEVDAPAMIVTGITPAGRR